MPTHTNPTPLAQSLRAEADVLDEEIIGSTEVIRRGADAVDALSAALAKLLTIVPHAQPTEFGWACHEAEQLLVSLREGEPAPAS